MFMTIAFAASAFSATLTSCKTLTAVKHIISHTCKIYWSSHYCCQGVFNCDCLLSSQWSFVNFLTRTTLWAPFDLLLIMSFCLRKLTRKYSHAVLWGASHERLHWRWSVYTVYIQDVFPEKETWKHLMTEFVDLMVIFLFVCFVCFRCFFMRPQWGSWQEPVRQEHTSCWSTTSDAGHTAPIQLVREPPDICT